MFKKIPLLLFLFFINLQAQDKIKGSRNVITEQYDISSFHSIVLNGEFETGLLKGSRPLIEIEADDNLHDLIQTEVTNGILYIKPLKEFSRTKSQKLKITFTDTLRSIKVNNKAELKGLQNIYVTNFHLESMDNAKIELVLKADTLNLYNNDNSKIELDIQAETVNMQLNQASEIKGIIKAEHLNADAYEKSFAKLEGEAGMLALRADQSAKFDAEDLELQKAHITAQGNSKLKVNIIELLEIKAKGNSETEVFNNPQVDLIEFTGKAVLAKKDFGRGIFN